MNEKQLEKIVLTALQQIKMAIEGGDNYSALRICEAAIQKLAAAPITEINTVVPKGVVELCVVE